MKRAWLLSTLLALGCGGETPGVRDQWLITVSSDAQLPTFGDRLFVELLDARGELVCPECRHLFSVSEANMPLAFGVTAEIGARRVRARLYRSYAAGIDGLPPSDTVLDAVGRLPPARGVTRVSLPLPMDCFGANADVEGALTCAPGDRSLEPEPELGPAPLLPPNSWEPGLRVPCPEPVDVGMSCIPGGAFLLGSARPFLIDDLEESPERLVQLSPFAIDREEISVGTIHSLLDGGVLTRAPPALSASICTYRGRDAHENDDKPLNCINFGYAHQVCSERGLRLPTEAEWEFVAENQGLDTRYPWGNGGDVCQHAYVAHGDFLSLGNEAITCQNDATAGPAAPVSGSATADETPLGGVRNLGGNLTEWVLDDLARFDSPCWHPELPLLVDPVCQLEVPPSPRLRASRGGNWTRETFTARSSVRGANPEIVTVNQTMGIRCVKPYPGATR